MSSRKKAGYNWRARRSGNEKPVKKSEKTCHVELDESLFGSNACSNGLDTNVQVLPPKRPKLSDEDDTGTSKRKRLNSKQRKRLLKVVEAKEKKVKHAAMLESLASLSLPDPHTSLLQPSIQLGKAGRRTQRQILNDAQVRRTALKGTRDLPLTSDPILSSPGNVSTLVGTTWGRKNRKRRRLKIEKLLLDPKTEDSGPPMDSTSESESGQEAEESCDSAAEQNQEFVKPKLKLLSEKGGGGGSNGARETGGVGMAGGGSDGGTHGGGEETCGVGVAGGGDGHGETGGVGVADGRADFEDQGRLQGNDGAVGGSRSGRTVVGRRGSGLTRYVQLKRDPDIQCSRLSLPILSEEQVVMEAIHDHPVVVLCGETGSGKTTQVPQFLYEAGYTMKGHGVETAAGGGGCGGRSVVAVTEPRRVAAVSMCRRVCEEMGFQGSEVAYQIRHEGTVTGDTVIKFMTDGVLLKEVEKDFLLSQYSAVVIDEAHERSVFTDILIGLLSRIVPLREKNGNPLKLVIMSATLRVEDFTENRVLFPTPPPVVKVESRQYPVTIHFNRRTPEDYMEEALHKVCKIHCTLQPGSILVFVTGQKEVHYLCRVLSRRFGRQKDGLGGGGGGTAPPAYTCDGKMEEDGELDDDDDEMEREEEEGEEGVMSNSPMLVLPLYSLLSSARQAKVFDPPPDGVRLCVVATNVAETSLTIPNVKYVVDTGKVKRRYYDKVTGISTFRVTWTSKASANQRAGRAGRTEPGHCYRLFSSSVFHNDFEQFSPPEITRRPVDDLVLQMKAMNIDRVTNFPFPTPPPPVSLRAAESLLEKLGALETPSDFRDISARSKATPLSVTPLGRTMAQFPVSPRYGKMLALGRQHGCLPYVVALVSALSVKELFVEAELGGEVGGTRTKDRWVRLRRSWAGKGECLLLGDLMVLIRVVGACEYAGCSEDFCLQNGVRRKAMLEVRKLRQQLTNIVNMLCPEDPIVLDPKMPPLSQEQAKYMRQIVLSGLGDHVARKIPTQGLDVEDKKRLRYAYQSSLCTDPVHMNSSAVLLHQLPEFVVFQEITETSKLYMRGVCAVDASWFPRIQPDHCTFSPPLEDPPPFFDDATGTVCCHKTCTYGDFCWPIGAHEMPYPNSLVRYRLFAMFLLQGKVIPALDKFSPFLLVPPIALLKKWSKLHKQCDVLVVALANAEVYSRQRLLDYCKQNPKYLLKAYSLWLPESRHKEVSSMWPLTN